MKKETILKTYRETNEDEGQTHLNTTADLKAFYSLSFLALVLMSYQTFKGLPFGDLPALLFIFLAVGAGHRYKATREKHYLWMSLATGLLCVGLLVWYVIQTW